MIDETTVHPLAVLLGAVVSFMLAWVASFWGVVDGEVDQIRAGADPESEEFRGASRWWARRRPW